MNFKSLNTDSHTSTRACDGGVGVCVRVCQLPLNPSRYPIIFQSFSASSSLCDFSLPLDMSSCIFQIRLPSREGLNRTRFEPGWLRRACISFTFHKLFQFPSFPSHFLSLYFFPVARASEQSSPEVAAAASKFKLPVWPPPREFNSDDDYDSDNDASGSDLSDHFIDPERVAKEDLFQRMMRHSKDEVTGADQQPALPLHPPRACVQGKTRLNLGVEYREFAAVPNPKHSRVSSINQSSSSPPLLLLWSPWVVSVFGPRIFFLIF